MAGVFKERLGIGKYPHSVVVKVTPELSKEIQEYIYANGGEANNGEKYAHNTEVKYLVVLDSGRIAFCLNDSDRDMLLTPKYNFTEIKVNSLQDFINKV